MHYLRLWLRFITIAFVQEAEYRTNFAVQTMVSLVSVGVAIATYAILYRFTPEVAGWSQAEALMLLGIFRVVEALIEMLIARNMWGVADAIRTGDMDYVLLRPVSSQFLATLQRVNVSEAMNVTIGTGLLIYAANVADVEWRIERVGVAMILALCGLILLYAFWCVTVTFAFWFQAGPLESVFHWFIDAGRYPVSFFKGWVRIFLTFVFPVAFAVTFPTEALLGEINVRTLAVGIILAALALVGSNRFWNYGVQHYSSASS